MRRFEQQVAAAVDEFAFAPGISSPKQKHQALPFFGQAMHHRIGKKFPAFVLMRAGLMGTNGEGGVEQQDSLAGPAFQIARGQRLQAQILTNFAKDVFERRGQSHPLLYREAKPVGLSWFVIGILSQNYQPDLFKRAEIKSVKNQRGRGIDRVLSVFLADKGSKAGKIIFFEFFAQLRLP